MDPIQSKIPPNNVSHASKATVDEDDDVILERENSAWDVLEERFKKNATEGNYIDLTDENVEGGRAISAEEAAETFVSIRQAGASGKMLSSATDGSKNEDVCNEAAAESAPVSSVVRKLGSLIHETIKDLQNVRGELQRVAQRGHAPASRLHRFVKQIDYRTKRIQSFVDLNADDVLESAVAMDRLEKMNLLVMKANAFIGAINQKRRTTSGNSGGGREGGGSGGNKRHKGSNGGGVKRETTEVFL